LNEDKKIENELNGFKDLIAKARRYRDTLMIREYIASSQQADPEKNQVLPDSEWINWARKKAD
jgi:hypothetical protein